MRLREGNIIEWLGELRKQMFELYGLSDYDKTILPHQWLEYYAGFTVEEAISEEVEFI